MYKTFLKAAEIGVVAGMRSMMAPALLSRHYAHNKPASIARSSFAFIESPKTAAVLGILAGGELVGDKLPHTPDRTQPGPVAGRAGSGALCGAVIAQAEGKSPALGALAGGLGALVGTYAFFQLRHWLTKEKGLPDIWVALAEDVLAIGGGLLILKPADV